MLKYVVNEDTSEVVQLSVGIVSKKVAFDIGASAVTGFGGFCYGLVCDEIRAMLK